jgi:hypothetical protein
MDNVNKQVITVNDPRGVVSASDSTVWLKTLSQTAESNCWTAFMEIKHVRLPGIDKSLPPCVTYDAAAVSDQYMPPYTIQHLQPLMLSTWSRLVTIWVKTKDHPAIRATARGRKSHIKSMSSLETPSHRLTLWKKKKLCSSHLGTALVFRELFLVYSILQLWILDQSFQSKRLVKMFILFLIFLGPLLT